VRPRAATLAIAAAALLGFGSSPAGAAASAPAPTAETSVIAGRTASIEELPWLAFIEARGPEGQFSCTGSVVAPRVVLTAGHCIKSEFGPGAVPAASYRVLTGVADRTKAPPANRSSVRRDTFYPSFETARPQVDAGLLILSAPVGAPALALESPAEPELLKSGTPLTIAGWGLTDSRAEEVPKVLRAADGLTVRRTGFCRHRVERSIFDFPAFTPSSQLCAQDGHRHQSGCFGDSGGPAIAHRADGTAVEVGIIVKGGFECTPKRPNVYTRVDRVWSWISAWIEFAERGGPLPPEPRPAPTYVSFILARQVSIDRLTHLFHRRFRTGNGRRLHCERRGWASVRCRVSWHQHRNHYFGSLTVSHVVTPRHFIADRIDYVVHWVRDGCGKTAHSGRCRVRTRQN
jgi:hypothetical protein